MFEFCLPTTGTKVTSSPEWLHEIKFDGYRLRVERNGDRVRLITRGGYDWTKRFPWIVEAALKNRQKHFVIDGEAVILGVDGYSDFNALHSGKHNDEVQLCAFDVLAMDGDHLRDLPLSMRKANLARLLARRPDGIFVSDFEQGEIGPDLFRAACRMGLEGLVSKRRDWPYQAGRSRHWIKIKNRKRPAMDRVMETNACELEGDQKQKSRSSRDVNLCSLSSHHRLDDCRYTEEAGSNIHVDDDLNVPSGLHFKKPS
jgi:bifunctional non-homologous end joining protein LigD